MTIEEVRAITSHLMTLGKCGTQYLPTTEQLIKSDQLDDFMVVVSLTHAVSDGDWFWVPSLVGTWSFVRLPA